MVVLPGGGSDSIHGSLEMYPELFVWFILYGADVNCGRCCCCLCGVLRKLSKLCGALRSLSTNAVLARARPNQTPIEKSPTSTSIVISDHNAQPSEKIQFGATGKHIGQRAEGSCKGSR
jgi:hypothetical protein